MAYAKVWFLLLFWCSQIIKLQFWLPFARSFLSHLTLNISHTLDLPHTNLFPPQPFPSQLIITPLFFQFLGPNTLKANSFSHTSHPVCQEIPLVYLLNIPRIWSLIPNYLLPPRPKLPFCAQLMTVASCKVSPPSGFTLLMAILVKAARAINLKCKLDHSSSLPKCLQ